MLDELRDDLKAFDVPKPLQADIANTIVQSKQLLQNAPYCKKETNKWKQLRTIGSLHFKRLLIIQIMLCSFSLLFAGNLFSTSFVKLSYYYDISLLCKVTIVCGSLLMSVTASLELLRSKLSNTWEIEKVCCIRSEKIILYKLLFTSIGTFISISFIAYGLTSVQNDINGFTIMLWGLLPYIIITSCIVQLDHQIVHLQSLITLFTIFSVFYIGCMQIININISITPLQSICTLIIIFTIFILMNAHKLLKQL